ncbi:MAG: hypothetical protein RIR90_1499 [Bacteroidota bacterium]|jgi:hypothetical protein
MEKKALFLIAFLCCLTISKLKAQEYKSFIGTWRVNYWKDEKLYFNTETDAVAFINLDSTTVLNDAQKQTAKMFAKMMRDEFSLTFFANNTAMFKMPGIEAEKYSVRIDKANKKMILAETNSEAEKEDESLIFQIKGNMLVCKIPREEGFIELGFKKVGK